jgi:mannose/fructose/sorbose-specific phosphotransferase system IIA component
MASGTAVRVIVACHSGLAQALLKTAESIAGPQPGVACLDLLNGESPAAFESRLAAAAAPGRPALILVDLMGGTPWNAAARLALRRGDARVVSGVNLPMLLEVALAGGDDVGWLARLAAEAGVQSVLAAPAPGAAEGDGEEGEGLA